MSACRHECGRTAVTTGGLCQPCADAPAPLPAVCLDCGKPYSDFPCDVILTRTQWLEIHPDEHGLLCASCIVTRAAKLPGFLAVHAFIEIAVPTPATGHDAGGEVGRSEPQPVVDLMDALRRSLAADTSAPGAVAEAEGREG